MNSGTNFKSGDIVLVNVHFTDHLEIKKRPALILYIIGNTAVIAGITSNTRSRGILITEKEGMAKDSVLKLNNVFSVDLKNLDKKYMTLNKEKRIMIANEIKEKLSQLIY